MKNKKKKSKPSSKNLKVLKKEDLLKYCRSVQTLKKVPFPELRDVPEFKKKFGDKAIPAIMIRGAGLDDHISCAQIGKDAMFLVAAILEKIKENGSITPEEIVEQFSSDKIHNFTMFELKLFDRSCHQPTFTFEEILLLATKCPEVISHVTTTALEMTGLPRTMEGE